MRWIVKIDNGEEFFSGSGLSLEEAIIDAKLQMVNLGTPKVGPGIWQAEELQKKLDEKKERDNGIQGKPEQREY